MESKGGFIIKLSCGKIGMILIAEFSRLDDIIIALSLLEDLKKELITYYECKPMSQKK